MRFAASKVLLALGIALSHRWALAETARLEELERRALRDRSTLNAAGARVDAASARVSAARAPLYPVLVGNVGADLAPGAKLVRVSDVSGDDYLVAGSRPLGYQGAFSADFRYAATLSFTARVLDFGRTSAEIRAARADVAAAESDVSAERRAVVLEVRNAYLDWLSAHGAREIVARRARDSKALRESVEAKIVEGSRAGAEASSARFEESRAELELEQSELVLETSRLALERAVGGPLSNGAEPDLAVLDRAVPSRPQVELPEVAALARRREAAHASASAHRRANAPVLLASSDAGLRGQGADLFPLYRVGVMVTIPVLDGGLSTASADVSESQARELDALVSETRSQASFERERLLASSRRLTRELVLASEMAETAARALRDAEEQHSLGTVGLDAVVEARIQQTRAELTLLEVRVARARVACALAGVQRR